INVLCHRALLIGYTREERQIDGAIIHQAAKELGRSERTRLWLVSKFLLSSSTAFATSLVLLTGVIFFLAATRGRLPVLTPSQSEETAVPVQRADDTKKEPLVPAAVPPQTTSATSTQPLQETPILPVQPPNPPSEPPTGSASIPSVSSSQVMPEPSG